MSKQKKAERPATVSDFELAMESIAATKLAQSWDNVGLLVGDRSAIVRRILFSIDLTQAVVEEATRANADALFCYHPPIFRPIHTLVSPGTGMESLVLQCARNGIALYSSHTALDAAEGGTNDLIAELCGMQETIPLEYVDDPGKDNVKVVVFVPGEHADRVANAAFAAGAGVIGDYTHCSYRGKGTGTFFATEGTNPAIGKRGRVERVDELRVELVAPRSRLPAVVAAIRNTHPYEEPAFDLYPLVPPPARGIGRVGFLPRKTTLATLARKLSGRIRATNSSIVGRRSCKVHRAIIIVGAAGSLPLRCGLGAGDVIVTGEIRHHDALAIARSGACAIALGHWTSEHPILSTLVRRLRSELPGVALKLARSDCEPFARF